MSAKVSDTFRQSKSRGFENTAPKKPFAGRSTYGNKTVDESEQESARDRELLVFDLTNKWGPCHGTQCCSHDVSETKRLSRHGSPEKSNYHNPGLQSRDCEYMSKNFSIRVRPFNL